VTRKLTVEVFTEPGCSVCEKAMIGLKSIGVDFVERHVQTRSNFTRDEFWEVASALSEFAWLEGDIAHLPLVAVVDCDRYPSTCLFMCWTGRDVAHRDGSWLDSARKFFEAHPECLKRE
jgi:glutaredoxin